MYGPTFSRETKTWAIGKKTGPERSSPAHRKGQRFRLGFEKLSNVVTKADRGSTREMKSVRALKVASLKLGSA
jgi:hypothetical protein